MTVNLGQKARDNLTGFVQTIARLAQEEPRFDLVVGAGDSGLAMVRLTEMVLTELGLPLPTQVCIPYFRFAEKDVATGTPFDGNAALIPDIRRQVQGIANVRHILFVDDEIGSGTTAQAVVDLLAQAHPPLFRHRPGFVIVAEDQGFQPDTLTGPVHVRFVPFATEIEGINNAISYVIPYEFERPIAARFSTDEYGDKARMNALLGLPVKALDGGKPVWSEKFLNALRAGIPDFARVQAGFDRYVRDFIRQAIQEER